MWLSKLRALSILAATLLPIATIAFVLVTLLLTVIRLEDRAHDIGQYPHITDWERGKESVDLAKLQEFSQKLQAMNQDRPTVRSHVNRIIVMYGVMAFAALWTLGLKAFYLFFLFKSNAVPKDQKLLWAVILILVNVFAMLVFWYLYIWRSRPSKLPAE